MEKTCNLIAIIRQIAEKWESLEYISSEDPNDVLALCSMEHIQEINYKFIKEEFSIHKLEGVLIKLFYVEKADSLIVELNSNLEIICNIFHQHSKFIVSYSFHEYNMQLIKINYQNRLKEGLILIKDTQEKLLKITDRKRKESLIEYLSIREKYLFDLEEEMKIKRKQTLWKENKHMFFDIISFCEKLQLLISTHFSKITSEQSFIVNPTYFNMEFSGRLYKILNNQIIECNSELDLYKFLNEPYSNKIKICKKQQTRLYYTIYLLEKSLVSLKMKATKKNWQNMILNNLEINKNTYNSKYKFIESQDASEADINFRNDIRLQINTYLENSNLAKLPPLKI